MSARKSHSLVARVYICADFLGRIRSEIIDSASKRLAMKQLTAFTWGYWGWGTHADEFVRNVDAVEPPVAGDHRSSSTFVLGVPVVLPIFSKILSKELQADEDING